MVVAALVVGVGADLAVGASMPGQTAATGFLGCGVIVLASKWLGRALLQRPETYYEHLDRDGRA